LETTLRFDSWVYTMKSIYLHKKRMSRMYPYVSCILYARVCCILAREIAQRNSAAAWNGAEQAERYHALSPCRYNRKCMEMLLYVCLVLTYTETMLVLALHRFEFDLWTYQFEKSFMYAIKIYKNKILNYDKFNKFWNLYYIIIIFLL
jgi:hypothetical protein